MVHLVTEAYRQKLLNWLCSALLVLAYLIFGLGIVWVDIIGIFAGLPNELFTLGKYAIPLSDAFHPFIYLFPLVIVWHLLDLIERDPVLPVRPVPFTRYRQLLIVLLVTGPLFVLAAPGGVYMGLCFPTSGGEFGFHMNINCPPPSNADAMFALICIPAMIALCIGKAIQAIRSHMAASTAA